MTHTLLKVALIAAAPTVALAQLPPVPPLPPAPKVAPAPKTAGVPKVAPVPPVDFPYHDLDELRWNAEELREKARHEVEAAKEMMLHFPQPDIRLELERAPMDMKVAFETSRADLERTMEAVRTDIAFAPMADVFYAPSPKGLLDARPRPAWASEDPADSLYRLARESLNRGEYRRAATLFRELTTRFASSQYALSGAYWEAFSRYRAGTTDDLREALKILDDGKDKFAYLRANESSMDVDALRARVLGALASRGDRAAAQRLQAAATQESTCDKEDVSVRAEALSALGQMDLASAMPVVKRVLGQRDECTVELRRRALYLIGRTPNSETAGILLEVAKNEPNANIRGEAMNWLSRVGGDQSIPMLEDILRTSDDERTQRSAVSALGTINTDRSRRAIRTIIERADAQENVRREAISSFARERDGRTMTVEDYTYLRTLYSRLESTRLKDMVLTVVSRVETPENEAFLLGIARSDKEPSSMRSSALQRLGRMKTVSVNQIGALYAVADSRSMREQILRALSQRAEPEAIDKLVEVAKQDTDYNIRRIAIQLLSRSENPKALQGIKELAEPRP